MPVSYNKLQLYSINEMTGPLRIETLQGKKPVTKAVQIEQGSWIIEIHSGMPPNLTLLGYLRDLDSTVPRTFETRIEAFEAISWCDDFIVMMP